MGDGHTAPVVNPWSTSNIGSAFAMKIHTTEPYNHRNKQSFLWCGRRESNPDGVSPSGF